MGGALRVPISEALYNRRVKINPLTGAVLEDVCCSKDIFNPYGLEKPDEPHKGAFCEDPRPEETDGSAIKRSAARAKKELFELCACNEFDLFFTLTLDKEKIDRYDYKEAVKRLSQWLDNRVRRRGLKYVAVPELHKDGAIHFHGLCNREACRLVDSGRRDKGHVIYNVIDWKLGFTTAIELYGDSLAAAHYVAKYVTKGTKGGTIGGRYYYHGGDLQKAKCLYYHEDFANFEGRVVQIDNAGISYTYRV